MPQISDKYRQTDLSALRKLRSRGAYFYALPNILTAGNFVFGYLAITFSIQQNYRFAAYSLLLAALFDLLDGRVARMTRTTSQFGMEFDSLCDLVSFGIAPSIMFYMASLKDFGRLGLAVTVAYALCGALRLARYNTFYPVLPKSHFQGLPIPIASATLATFVFFSSEFAMVESKNYLSLVLVSVLAILMVSTLRFPSFKDLELKNRRPMSVLFPLLGVLLALIVWFEVSAFAFLAIYIIVSLITDFVRRIGRGRDFSH